MESSHEHVRTEWYQSLDAVTFTYFIKNRSASDVHVNLQDKSYEIVIKLDGENREFHHSIDPLYASIQTSTNQSQEVNNGTHSEGVIPYHVTIRPIKVEVKIYKVTPAQWPVLEGSEEVIHTIVPESSASSSCVATHRATKNWNEMKLDDDDVNDKPEGEDALNKLFQQIYGNGTDEQRRAMIKSFTESGGTVLSTNWDDVGHREVKAEPPTGMEAKKVSE